MRIRLQVGFVVDFKSHAALAQFVHSFFYAVYGKIQHRESGGLVVGLGVQQSFGAAGKGHNQGAFWTVGKFEPQRFAIKFLRFLNIVHRKAAECLAFVEHWIPSGSFDLLDFDAELFFAVFECGTGSTKHPSGSAARFGPPGEVGAAKRSALKSRTTWGPAMSKWQLNIFKWIKTIWRRSVHLKPDPVAVEFLKQFGLAFLYVISGAMSVVSYGSIWHSSKQRRSIKPRHKDEPKVDE
jgi:hypothetical protein